MRVNATETPSVLFYVPSSGGGEYPGGVLPDNYTRGYLARNRTATASIYLEVAGTGPADVTTVNSGTAFEWKAADPAMTLELEPGQGLHAVVAGGGGTQIVEYLLVGR